MSYRRRYKECDYLFLVNDQRQYGAYVGQHGLVMENGLPTECNVVLRRTSGHIYDLLASAQVAARPVEGELRFPWRLGPCDGRLFLVTDCAIERVGLTHPEKIPRGTSASLSVTVADRQGSPIEAVLPLRVDIRDAEGRQAERSGYYGAVNGRLRIELDIACNDPFGAWTVEVRDLASGRMASGSFMVPGPEVWPPISRPVPKGATGAVQPDG